MSLKLGVGRCRCFGLELRSCRLVGIGLIDELLFVDVL